MKYTITYQRTLRKKDNVKVIGVTNKSNSRFLSNIKVEISNDDSTYREYSHRTLTLIVNLCLFTGGIKRANILLDRLLRRY